MSELEPHLLGLEPDSLALESDDLAPSEMSKLKLLSVLARMLAEMLTRMLPSLLLLVRGMSEHHLFLEVGVGVPSL